MLGEVSLAFYQNNTPLGADGTPPAGAKQAIPAEVWGDAGVLRGLWYAGGGPGPLEVTSCIERGGTLRIFTDNDTEPDVNEPIGMFFGHYPLCAPFAGRWLGRSTLNVGGGWSGAYRYLWAPFRNYLRVEFENNTAIDSSVYLAAWVTLVPSATALGDRQLNYQHHVAGATDTDRYSQLTVADVRGSCQLESIQMMYFGVNNDVGVLEGNWFFLVDGQPRPLWHSSGTEDAFGGSFYNVPVGGHSLGAAGDPQTPAPATGRSYYRFFDRDVVASGGINPRAPRLKVVADVGQIGQGAPPVQDVQVDFTAIAGIWFNAFKSIKYRAVDTATPPSLVCPRPAVGSLAGLYTEAPGSLFTGTAAGTLLQADVTGDDTYAYPAAAAAIAQPMWAECSARIANSGLADGQEAFLALTGDGTLADSIAVELKFVAATHWGGPWVVAARDGTDTPFFYEIAEPNNDLSNEWIDLAIKLDNTIAVAYWRFHMGPVGLGAHLRAGAINPWLCIGRWTTTKVPTRVAVKTKTAHAEFTRPIVRPLRAFTR